MKKKKIIMFLIFLIIVILIISFLLIYKESNKESSIIGIYETLKGTIYEFKKNNEGIMETTVSKYKFNYTIKDNEIYIDFEDEDLFDSTYKYTIEDSVITMKNDKGSFIFNKK